MSSHKISPTIAHERARIASLSRSRQPDDPDLIVARQNLKAEKLAEYVARVVAEAPPISVEQRQRIAMLLNNAEHGLVNEVA